MPATKTKFNQYDVQPCEGGWEVRSGDGRKEYPTKEKALAAAKEEAKAHMPSSLRVHGRDGRFQQEYSYGRDPRTSKG